MRISSLLLALAAAGSLSACMSTPTERALGGAAAGAVAAEVLDGDLATGALIGAGLGAVSCGVAGLPRCR